MITNLEVANRRLKSVAKIVPREKLVFYGEKGCPYYDTVRKMITKNPEVRPIIDTETSHLVGVFA